MASSSSQQVLVAGSVLNQERYNHDRPAPGMFNTRTIPDIDENTVIIAAASPDLFTGSPQRDGWFLSDFYAFNLLFKGLGHSQTWLTAADPNALVAKYGQFLHGNEYQGRKVVLSKDIIEDDQITSPTIVHPDQMIDRFVHEVRSQSAEAVTNDRPVLLMIFCHGLPNYQYLLKTEPNDEYDFDDFVPSFDGPGLSVPRLKEAIADRCRVAMLSTACFSGGWVVQDAERPGHQPMNVNALLAAAHWDTSTAWQISGSISKRSCGSIFASSVIQALTSATSPLLDENESNTQDAANSSIQKPASLQPKTPNDVQTNTYAAFCTSILHGCRDNIHRLWEKHKFTFAAKDDQWELPWTKRTGVPLANFESRWNALETVPFTGTPERKGRKDPSPNNPYNTGELLESLTGGLSIEHKIEDEVVSSNKQQRVKILVGLFLKTCPGDWDSGTDVALCSQLMSVVDGRQLEMRFDAIAVVCYRWQLAHLADVLVRVFGLPKPNGESCLMWRYHDWRASAGKVFQYFDQRYSAVWGQLVNSSFEPRPLRDQGPPFYRFQRYVTAAVVEADLGPDATRALVNKLIEYMVAAKKTLQEQVIQDKEIRHRGRNWIKSVGRAVRRSLSPRKSISGQSYRDRSDTATSRHSRGGSSSSVMDNKPILTSPRASTESQRPSFDIVRRLSERKGKGSKK